MTSMFTRFIAIGRASIPVCVVGLMSLSLAACGDVKKLMGIEKTSPDEFAVESRAPLTIPPDFDLRAGSRRRPAARGQRRQQGEECDR